MHFENRVRHKERESNQQTKHEVGKTGSIRSRSCSRVTSRVHSGAASLKSEPKQKHRSSKSHASSGAFGSSEKQSSGACGTSKKHSSGAGGASEKGACGASGTPKKHSKSPSNSQCPTLTGRERCYDVPRRRRPQPCTIGPKWQTGKYKRDICGSGIEPAKFDFLATRRRLWCKTPLSMYQATIGELGRKLLCREAYIPRDVWPGPPSNIEEYILPPCRGYYRKYDCLRPCEEDFAVCKQGKKVYRDRVQRYWEPCLTKEQKHILDINTFAHHNAALGLKVRRFNLEIPCW